MPVTSQKALTQEAMQPLYQTLCYTAEEAAEQLGISETVLLRLSQFFQVPAQAYSAGKIPVSENLLLTEAEVHFFREARQRLLGGQTLDQVKQSLLADNRYPVSHAMPVQASQPVLEEKQEAVAGTEAGNPSTGTVSSQQATPESIFQPAVSPFKPQPASSLWDGVVEHTSLSLSQSLSQNQEEMTDWDNPDWSSLREEQSKYGDDALDSLFPYNRSRVTPPVALRSALNTPPADPSSMMKFRFVPAIGRSGTAEVSLTQPVEQNNIPPRIHATPFQKLMTAIENVSSAKNVVLQVLQQMEVIAQQGQESLGVQTPLYESKTVRTIPITKPVAPIDIKALKPKPLGQAWQGFQWQEQQDMLSTLTLPNKPISDSLAAMARQLRYESYQQPAI